MSKVEVQLWFSEATEAGCRVYAEWTTAAAQPEAWLQGPQSPYASTLQARYPLRRRAGAADGPLEAWIDEPCFWTPAGPYVYRWEFRFPPPAAALTGLLGIRRLSVRRDYLEFDLKRWVLRGATAREPLAVKPWHEALMAPLVENPSDETCEQASRVGVLLVARLAAEEDVGAELRRLARWPAVGAVILSGDSQLADPRSHAPNLIFAQWFPAGAALEPAAWARLLFCEVDEPNLFARRVAGFSLPVVAVRRDQSSSSPAESRAACDRLQRELAAAGVQMAGYIV